MEVSFRDLTEEDKEYLSSMYLKNKEYKEDGTPLMLMDEIQKEVALKYNVTTRTVRNWAKSLGLNVMLKNVNTSFKVMIYDIETSRVPAMVFWTGKTYVSHGQLKEDPKIISIAWKWLGEDEVKTLVWSKSHCDKKLVKDFLLEYNKANMVIGQNNDKFDNRWVNARAAKHGLHINTMIKSFDIMKQAKRLFRLPSYSMAYMAKYFGVTNKQSHEGIHMWDMIQDGTKEEQAEYLQKMVDYNVGDIITTEELYLRLRKYMGHKVHKGVFTGKPKWTCPNCGGSNVGIHSTQVTPAGTIQRIMICKDDGVQYKVSNKTYMDFLDDTKIDV